MTSPAGPRFAANLSLLFTEYDLLGRPAAARRHGFDAVELWWPFPGPVPPPADLDRLADSLDEAGVQLVALNLDGGDLDAGERGLVSLPRMASRFRDNVDCVAGFARRTGTRMFNALYGNETDDPAGRARSRDTALEQLAYAAGALADVGGTVLLETQNRIDAPRYPLTDPEQVAGLMAELDAAGHPGVRFLCDLYHLRMSGFDPAAVVADRFDLIGHVQVADAPGRHEPGTGRLDLAAAMAALTGRGYDGWVAAEYRPTGRTADGLGWLTAFRASDHRGGR